MRRSVDSVVKDGLQRMRDGVMEKWPIQQGAMRLEAAPGTDNLILRSDGYTFGRITLDGYALFSGYRFTSLVQSHMQVVRRDYMMVFPDSQAIFVNAHDSVYLLYMHKSELDALFSEPGHPFVTRHKESNGLDSFHLTPTGYDVFEVTQSPRKSRYSPPISFVTSDSAYMMGIKHYMTTRKKLSAGRNFVWWLLGRNVAAYGLRSDAVGACSEYTELQYNRLHSCQDIEEVVGCCANYAFMPSIGRDLALRRYSVLQRIQHMMDMGLSFKEAQDLFEKFK